jgi:hypothetical protein
MRQDDVDWDDHFTRLTSKSQWVKKLPARGGNAKAPQTVATFPKNRIFEDAMVATYIDPILESWRRPTTYLHNRPLAALREHGEKYWVGGDSSANDYTAWDSGCDEVFALFDCWLLEMAGVPDSFIAGYLHRKLNTRCYLGHLLPMQHSGDRFTWLFNTTRNAALTGASVGCDAATPCAFSGDDSIILGVHPPERSFRPRAWLMTPKPEVGPALEFCGFTFSRGAPVISPAVLHYRAQLSLRRGVNDPSSWRSLAQAVPFSTSSAALDSTAALIDYAQHIFDFRIPDSDLPFLTRV